MLYNYAVDNISIIRFTLEYRNISRVQSKWWNNDSSSLYICSPFWLSQSICMIVTCLLSYNNVLDIQNLFWANGHKIDNLQMIIKGDVTCGHSYMCGLGTLNSNVLSFEFQLGSSTCLLGTLGCCFLTQPSTTDYTFILNQ